MHKPFILALMIYLLAMPLLGQHKSSRKLEFQIKPSAGLNIPLSKLLQNKVTDDLISYDDNSYYWQVLAFSLFFHKHWGIEFNLQGSTSGKITKRNDRFVQSLENAYSNNYYVAPYTWGGPDESNIILGHIPRGYLGVIYRLESDRFFIYPKLAVGVTSFYADYGRAYLKEKDANNVVEVLYEAGNPPKDNITLAAATTAGYKLNKWLYLNVDLLGSWYKTQFTYVKTLTDLHSGQAQSEETRYHKNIFGLSVGAGLIISLKKR